MPINEIPNVLAVAVAVTSDVYGYGKQTDSERKKSNAQSIYWVRCFMFSFKRLRCAPTDRRPVRYGMA